MRRNGQTNYYWLKTIEKKLNGEPISDDLMEIAEVFRFIQNFINKTDRRFIATWIVLGLILVTLIASLLI